MNNVIFPKSTGLDKNEQNNTKFYCNEENLCNDCWIIGTSYKWIEIFFSLFTAVYFIVIFSFLSATMSRIELRRTFFWGVVLTLLPFYRVRRVIMITSTPLKRWFDFFTIRSFPFRAAISSMILILAISYMGDFVDQNLLVMYFALTISFRMVDSSSLYEAVALCIAYSANLNGFLSVNQRRYFASSRLIIWSFLLFGFVCGTILWRSAFRIWQHIRLLIIFDKKSKQERVFSNLIAAAHFSPDVLLSPDVILSSTSKDAEVIHRDSADENLISDTSYYDFEINSNLITKSAKAKGILFSVDENPILSIDKILSLNGLERKLATVIAFKLTVSNERECSLNNQGGHAIHELLDSIASRHKISCVRKFGDTWVGHIGFHKTWANSRTDSYHAILMGCEALVIAKKLQLRLCCAVESGKIDAGFIECSNSDIFGPEIRWVLNMVEATKNDDLLVGTSARNLNTRKLDSLAAVIVHFERITINSIWKTSQDYEKVYSVSSPFDLVLDQESLIQEFLDDDLMIKSCISNEDTDTPPMSWQAVQSILDGNILKSNLKSVTDRGLWNDELGCELQMSIEDRFGMSLDDVILQRVPEIDLKQMHIQIEDNVRSLMKEHFFGSCLNLLILISPSKYRRGVNDQMMPVCSLKMAKESQEFLCPLESILRENTPFLYTLVLKTFGDGRQMNYNDTDEFLKNKIKKEALAHLTPNISENGSIRSVADGSNRSHGSIRSPNSSVRSNTSRSAFISESSRANGKTNNAGSSRKKSDSSRANASIRIHRANNKCVRIQPCNRDIESGLYDEEKELDSSTTSLNRIRRPGVQINPRISLNTSLKTELLKKPQNKENNLSSRSMLKHTNNLSSRSILKHKKDLLESSKDGKHKTQLLQTDESSSKFTRVQSNLDVPGRGLSKYTSDTRNLEKNLIGLLFTIPAICGNLLILLNEDHSNYHQHKALSTYYVFGLLATILFMLNLFERKYDNFICVVTLIGRSLLMIFTIPYLLENGDPEGRDALALPELFLFMLGLWFPVAIRQSFRFNCLEIVLLLLVGLYASFFFNCKAIAVNFYVVYLLLMVFLLIILWTIEYLSIVSYVIENLLLPEAQVLYQREYINSREMLHACSPSVPPERASSLYCPRRYRNCSILAVHVKAADVLPGLVDVLTVASFMKEIMLLIDRCIKECGLLNITHFSGVFIAACPDLSDDNTPISHTTRTVICLRKIQTKLDAFSRRHSVNVSMGAGLTCGPVTMGLLGNSRFCFDMSGAARDLAVFMASHQNDGIFASEIFGPDIRNGQMSDDLVVREVTVVSAHKTMKWLQLDGAFNKGMQLDDFDYMCMLGKGGFGSVHLLSENATEKEYAIKAIPRKTGSAIPKMIQREFIILQQIQHANVVSFKYCIINKNMIYLVMQYVRGGNLKQIVERNKPDLKHLTLWFAELILALDYIHSLGIIHRDVKPANCMIDASGHLKLADFGLSKIVTPTPTSVFDPMGHVAEGDHRNDASTTAINLIKSILPLKSNMTEGGEVNLPERSVKILLIDLNLMSHSAKRLREMYFKVTTVSTSVDARKALSKNLKAEIILVDLDSVNMSDPTQTMTSGLALLRRLVMETSKNIPIIGLSSIDDKDLTKKIINAGAKEVLALPIQKSAREILLKNIRVYQHLKRSSLKGTTTTTNSTSPVSTRIKKKNEREGTQSGSTMPEIELEGAATSTLFSHATDVTKISSPKNSHNNLTSQFDENAEVHQLRSKNNSNLKQLEPRLVDVSDGQQKHSAVGTIHFIAPEVIFERRYGRSVDWWACGVTFYECTVRQHLFSGIEKDTIIQQILAGPIDLSPLGEHSFLLQNLVSGLLVRDPKLRLGTERGHTIMRHNFFKDIDWNTISESEPNYKPAQHVNQRHNVKDKMLFYGQPEEKVAKDKMLPKAKEGSYKKGVVGAATLNQTRKKEKKVEMRNKKETFQQLTNIRKRWVSGKQLVTDDEAEKKTPSEKKKRGVAGSSFRGLSLRNSNDSGRVSGASLDWSITMLKEEDDDELVIERK